MKLLLEMTEVDRLSQIYVHYGSREYHPELFLSIHNRDSFSKPGGGLWASRDDARYGWRDWCRDNDYSTIIEENSFRFTISNAANILYLKTEEDLLNIPLQGNSSPIHQWYFPDFERMLAEGVDAVEVIDIDQLYYPLYGWDCESIVVMNPDIIIPLDK